MSEKDHFDILGKAELGTICTNQSIRFSKPGIISVKALGDLKFTTGEVLSIYRKTGDNYFEAGMTNRNNFLLSLEEIARLANYGYWVDAINSFPAIGSWIKLKLKVNDKNGKSAWYGQVESINDEYVTLFNGRSATGGEAESATIPWSQVSSYTYFRDDEKLDYYTDE